MMLMHKTALIHYANAELYRLEQQRALAAGAAALRFDPRYNQ